MTFREWLIKEGGKGSGPKISATGFSAGGQASAGVGMFKPAKPHLRLTKKTIFNKLVP